MKTRKTIAAGFAAAATIVAAVALVPSSALAQDDVVVPNVLAAPIALAEAPFVAADDLLFGGPIYAPGPVYAYAGSVPEAVPIGEPGWLSYCSARYRSFDPATSTYMGFDGVRHYCR